MRRSVALLLTGMLCACGGSSAVPEESKPSGTVTNLEPLAYIGYGAYRIIQDS